MGRTLGALVSQNTLAADERALNSGPDPARCVVVRRVATGPIAFGLGLKDGNLLVRVNEKSSIALKGPSRLRQPEREFHFFSGASLRIKVETTGSDPGFTIEMQSTPSRNFRATRQRTTFSPSGTGKNSQLMKDCVAGSSPEAPNGQTFVRG